MMRSVMRLLSGLATLFGAAAVARTYSETPVAAPRPEPGGPSGDPPAAAQPTSLPLGELQRDAKAALRPGWNRLQPEKLPRPTYWPAILALGVALTLWGVISTIFLWVMGLLLLIVGAAGWVWELVAEGAEEAK